MCKSHACMTCAWLIQQGSMLCCVKQSRATCHRAAWRTTLRWASLCCNQSNIWCVLIALAHNLSVSAGNIFFQILCNPVFCAASIRLVMTMHLMSQGASQCTVLRLTCGHSSGFGHSPGCGHESNPDHSPNWDFSLVDAATACMYCTGLSCADAASYACLVWYVSYSTCVSATLLRRASAAIVVQARW